jgi:hypothetical protein
MTDNSKSHIGDLIRIGAFRIDDLEINKSGHLSKKQKQPLYWILAFWFALAIFEIIIFAVFAYVQISLQRDIFMGLAVIAFLIFLLATCMAFAKPSWNDIRHNKSKTVSGKIFKHFSITSVSKYSLIGNCSIRINNQVFSISPSIYNQIIHENSYRIYFTPHSRKIINIEPL